MGCSAKRLKIPKFHRVILFAAALFGKYAEATLGQLAFTNTNTQDEPSNNAAPSAVAQRPNLANFDPSLFQQQQQRGSGGQAPVVPPQFSQNGGAAPPTNFAPPQTSQEQFGPNGGAGYYGNSAPQPTSNGPPPGYFRNRGGYYQGGPNQGQMGPMGNRWRGMGGGRGGAASFNQGNGPYTGGQYGQQNGGGTGFQGGYNNYVEPSPNQNQYYNNGPPQGYYNRGGPQGQQGFMRNQFGPYNGAGSQQHGPPYGAAQGGFGSANEFNSPVPPQPQGFNPESNMYGPNAGQFGPNAGTPHQNYSIQPMVPPHQPQPQPHPPMGDFSMPGGPEFGHQQFGIGGEPIKRPAMLETPSLGGGLRLVRCSGQTFVTSDEEASQIACCGAQAYNFKRVSCINGRVVMPGQQSNAVDQHFFGGHDETGMIGGHGPTTLHLTTPTTPETTTTSTTTTTTTTTTTPTPTTVTTTKMQMPPAEEILNWLLSSSMNENTDQANHYLQGLLQYRQMLQQQHKTQQQQQPNHQPAHDHRRAPLNNPMQYDPTKHQGHLHGMPKEVFPEGSNHAHQHRQVLVDPSGYQHPVNPQQPFQPDFQPQQMPMDQRPQQYRGNFGQQEMGPPRNFNQFNGQVSNDYGQQSSEMNQFANPAREVGPTLVPPVPLGTFPLNPPASGFQQSLNKPAGFPSGSPRELSFADQSRPNGFLGRPSLHQQTLAGFQRPIGEIMKAPQGKVASWESQAQPGSNQPGFELSPLSSHTEPPKPKSSEFSLDNQFQLTPLTAGESLQASQPVQAPMANLQQLSPEEMRSLQVGDVPNWHIHPQQPSKPPSHKHATETLGAYTFKCSAKSWQARESGEYYVCCGDTLLDTRHMACGGATSQPLFMSYAPNAIFHDPAGLGVIELLNNDGNSTNNKPNPQIQAGKPNPQRQLQKLAGEMGGSMMAPGRSMEPQPMAVLQPLSASNMLDDALVPFLSPRQRFYRPRSSNRSAANGTSLPAAETTDQQVPKSTLLKCGSRHPVFYDPLAQFCCGEFVYDTAPGQTCCDGTYGFSTNGQLGCCGQLPYNLNTHACTDANTVIAKY